MLGYRAEAASPTRRGQRRLLAALVLGAAASRQAIAQTGALDTTRARLLEPVVTTAARRPERRSNATIATSVISREAIVAAGATDVAAIVVQQLGVQTAPGSPAGASVYIQGLGDQRILVLLDGQPLVGRIGGTFDLSRVPTSMVERIEIVKGPQSVLYGSDAMGGVINIVTRTPGRQPSRGLLAGMEAAVVAGSHDRLDASAHIAPKVPGNAAYSLDVGRRGVALAPGIANDAAARADRWDIAPRIVMHATPALSLDVGGLGVVEHQRYRTGQLFNFSDNDQIMARAGALWQRGTHRLVPTVSLSRFEHLSRASTTGRPASDSGARDKQQLAKVELGYSGLVRGLLLDAGSEVRREWISADRIEQRERELSGTAFYVQATWMREVVSVMPGLRLGWNEAWGKTFTPRLAVLARPLGAAHSLALRASIARGFRAPDFKELYLDFVNQAAGYAVRGNPLLRPERSTNLSVDADWTGMGVEFHSGAFHNRFIDFIETAGPDTRGTFTYGNMARGTIRGLELELQRAVGVVGFGGGYTFLHARNDANAGPLLGRASQSARATVSIAPAVTTRLSATALYTGVTPLARGADGRITAERSPLTQINVRLARRIALPASASTDISLGANNVLNHTLGQSWPGFTGRSLYIGAAWSFE